MAQLRRLPAAALIALIALASWRADAAPEPRPASFTRDNPAVLTAADGNGLTIAASPERGLYDAGSLPTLAIRAGSAPAGASLAVRVTDGFGSLLTQQSLPAAKAGGLTVKLPPGHGYYEVTATLSQGGTTLAEVRRSIGALGPPAPATGDEPFGLWIQGADLYPQLGVRWTREGVDWRSYDSKGRDYMDKRIALFDRFHRQGIRVIAYPKELPKPFKTSREVLADTPEAWRTLEQWWTEMVRTLGPHVDAWAVVNEPMRDNWKGDNDLIVRYWALMRRIVDRYDPGKPLLGPSLSPNRRIYVDQYADLLQRGFGKLIDTVEMHTYIDDPQAGWAANTRKVADMTRAATGRSLPIWSTEHGSSADYAGELRQAQHLVRSWLEAKKIGYPVMIWHMFSHPQGTDRREVLYSIFRNVTDGSAAPQPRPAGVAYGVATRQLAGAVWRGEARVAPGVQAYVFSRRGQTMAAVWAPAGPQTVTLPAQGPVTVTDMFGAAETVQPSGGSVRLPVDASPKFVAPLSAGLAVRGTAP
jgi:hypothetical protein